MLAPTAIGHSRRRVTFNVIKIACTTRSRCCSVSFRVAVEQPEDSPGKTTMMSIFGATGQSDKSQAHQGTLYDDELWKSSLQIVETAFLAHLGLNSYLWCRRPRGGVPWKRKDADEQRKSLPGLRQGTTDWRKCASNSWKRIFDRSLSHRLDTWGNQE